MYYLQSRYYDPVVGRFINGDIPEILTVVHLAGKASGSSIYIYCGNDPIDKRDPTGCYHLQQEANWLIGALYSSIISIQLSGAALATKVSALILTVAPYLFWIVVAVAAIVVAYFVTQMALVNKAHLKILQTVKKTSKVRYWSATLFREYVDIGRALTYSQAVAEVKAGRNVFAVTWYEAKAVAIAAGGRTGKNNKTLYPEIDKGKENTKGYYWHYHTYNRKGGHVYYLF